MRRLRLRTVLPSALLGLVAWALPAQAGPTLRVTQAWDGVVVAKGSTVVYVGNVPAGTPDSRLFNLTNTGNATLTITNPTTLVSGANWSEIVTPVATLAPGATTSVRVRILSSTGGTFTGTVSISSNDTANNPFTFSVQATVDPPPAPNVQVSRAWDGVNVSKGSTVVYVGNVPAGTSDSRLFNLTNTGNATLNLSNPNTLVSGANWYLIQAPTTPLAPGATTTFRVRILSATGGTFTGTVSIASDDPNDNPFSFSVQATVDPPPAPNVQVSRAWDGVNVSKGSTVVYVGNVPAGTSDSRLFNLTNTGNATLNLSNPNTLVSGANWYLIQAPTTPLAPGATTTFRVRILSGTGGTFTGTVSIASDDPNDNPFSFSVQATVDPPPAPKVQVSQAWDGVNVARGSTVTYVGSVPVGTPDSRLFNLTNTGNATLNLSNPNTLVSGANWYLIQAPTTPLAPGATTTFRVRIYATTAGTFTGTVSIASDDPASPFAFNVQATVVPPQAPNVQVSRAWDGVNVAKGSTVIYAGSVPAGTSDSRLFNLTNTGNATLNISNPNTLVSGANWYLIQAPTTPLAPGATTTFRVRIYSTSGGTFTGTVSIASDDPDDNPFNFNVQATVEAPLAPEIRVFREWDGGELQSGSSFVFPDIEPGLADSRLFRIQNDGTATLNLTNANSLVSGPCFYQIGDPVASSLAPGAVTYVRVRLLCAATGQQSGSLTIESNDSDESTFVVSLGGRVGSLPPIRVEAPGAAAVPYGSTFSYSDTGVGVPDSRLFTVYNDGTGPVTLAAPSGLVSGEGFYQIGDPPLASIPAGGSVQFRVRLYHLSVGTWTGHITLETTNPAERPFRFDVTGRTGIPDFTVTLSPASRSLLPGQGTSYTATVTPAFGFADPVSLSVAGLPASSSGIFTPTSVAPGTTANLQISTTAATPPGNSTLTITGTSGTLSHAATVSLTVRSASDFALAASPSLLSVEQGGSTTSSVSVSADTSISGGVNLSVSGLPKGATASFAPSNIQVGGTSTLTVTADASASQGIYDLTITGVGGGLTRTTTAQLRVSSNEKPILNRITPDSFVRGGTTRVRIEGQRLRGASVSIALEQPDPSDPVERYFPTAQLVSISADGTTMDVDIVASDQRILDFYNLVVDNGSGQEAIQFRVLPPGPLADAWSPANPAQGGLYALSIAGRHLAGTTVTPSVSGRVVLHGVETGESEITALLEVLPNAPAGPIDLLVRDAQGREVRVPITIEPPGNSLKRDFDLTARRGGEPAALAGGVAPPRILAQEFAVRDPDATENLENGIQVRAFDTQAHLERRSANSVSFGAYIRVRYTLIHAQWQKVIVYNPVTGELGAEILQALNIGQRVPLGAFVFSAYFNMDLTIYFGLTNTGFSFPRFCIELAYGAEITGFDGFAYAASFCVGGGWVAYGTASTVSSGQMDGGDCASVTPLGMQDGLLFGEVQQNRCCPQPISVAMSGRTFTGFSFGKNFSVSDPAAATTSSAVTQCPCTVQVDPATLTPSQPSSINAYVQNDSDQVATYNWTVQKTSGTTGVQFSPSSGTVTVNPHKVAAFAVSVSLPSGAPAPDTPEFSFSVTNTGCQSATTASACVYPDNETSTFEGWWTVEPSDVACFKGNLAPSSTSFSGRRVTEGNPNSGIGSFDNCYYTGSVYPNYAMENISGGNWQIVSGNRYNESDLIGFKCTKPPNQQCSFDTYYLQRHPTGCSVGTTQTMHMSCVNSATPDFSHSLAYQHNVLLIEATPNGTRITRDGTASPLH